MYTDLIILGGFISIGICVATGLSIISKQVPHPLGGVCNIILSGQS